MPAPRRGRPDRPDRAKRAQPNKQRRTPPPRDRAPKSWGGVARRGARQIDDDTPAPGSASAAWRSAVDKDRDKERRQRDRGRSPGEERHTRPPEPWQPDRWVEDDEPVRDEARRAIERSARARRRTTRADASQADGDGAGGRKPRKAPEPVAGEIARAVAPARAPALEGKLMDAARAYERERYRDARRILGRLVQQAPDAPAVRELYGLTLYRLGQWAPAAKELERFRAMTGSLEQHPVLADCYRALRRWRKVDALWDELREASPSADLVTEGRIVAAGGLADRGQLRQAVRLLEQASRPPKRPKPHHLRLAYALADLYERTGEVPRARDLFRRVVDNDRDFADAAERLAALGS